MCPDPTGALPAPAALPAQDDRPPRLRPLQDLPVGRLAQLRGVLTCRWLLYLMALKALKDISLDALVYCE